MSEHWVIVIARDLERRAQFSRALAKKSFNVASASFGGAPRLSADCVVVIPGRPVIEPAQWIGFFAEVPHAKVRIAITEKNDMESAVAAARARASEVLSEPVAPDALTSAIGRVLAQLPAHEAKRRPSALMPIPDVGLARAYPAMDPARTRYESYLFRPLTQADDTKSDVVVPGVRLDDILAPGRGVDVLWPHAGRSFDRAALQITAPDAEARALPLDTLLRLLEHAGEGGGVTDAFAVDALVAYAETDHELSVATAILTSAGASSFLIARCARVLAKHGLVRRAAGLVRDLDDPDARLLAADLAAAIGREPEALRNVAEAQRARVDTLGAEERMRRWRRAIFGDGPPPVRPAVAVRWRGTDLTLLLERESILGRVHASMVVSAPVVSRRHLSFKRIDGGAVVEDLGSSHGTRINGAPMTGPVVLERPMTLVIGGNIDCQVAPAEGGAVDVEVGGRRYRCALAPAARLGEWIVAMSEEGLRVTHASRKFVAPTGEAVADWSPGAGDTLRVLQDDEPELVLVGVAE